jgi:hypothetical protein
MARFDDLFQDDDKIKVSFTYTHGDKSITLNHTYDDDTHWEEIVNGVVSALESQFGYAFNISDSVGIYYPGKNNDE